MATYEDLIHKAPKGKAVDFFDMTDRSEQFNEFFDNSSKNKSIEDNKIPLPTEIDPRAKEEIEWVKENMEKVFPNILAN